jgi:hypothetical protein
MNHDKKLYNECYWHIVGYLQHGVQSSPPMWLKRCCIPLLVQCLIKPNGVSALVRAICDTSCDIGSDWSKLDTVVKVILTVHVQHAEQYYKNICSQVKLYFI